MRVFFLMLFYIDEPQKNNTKLAQQMEAVRNLGHDVYFIGVGYDALYLCHDGKRELIRKLHNSKINLIIRQQMCVAAIKVINSGVYFDIAYVRSMTSIPSFVKTLKLLRKSGTTIIEEIPTYPDSNEAEHEKRISRKIAKKILMPLEIQESQYVNLYTLIGEIATEYHGVRAINISNGIDASKVEPWKKKANPEDDIHLIALGNFCYWHGYERLINGLISYYKSESKLKVYVHFVGPDKDKSLEYWINQAKDAKIAKYVSADGALYDEELNGAFSQSDFAIAALGGYKKGLMVDSSLKSLNYLARGIPFVHTGITFESPEINPYLIKVPNNAEDIDIQHIVDRVRDNRNRENIQSILRHYCIEKCSWEKQFEYIFSELSNVKNK